MKYQIFGSEDSIDYDIMVFVNNIPNTQESHELCSYYDEKLSKIFTDKKVNSNLAIVSKNMITKVFKGTVDEVNNCLYYTYRYHKQHNENHILETVERDLNLKVLRTVRVLLSFLSRTKARPIIKKALRGDLNEKVRILRMLNLTKFKSLNNKNIIWEDYLKVMSFQLGQTLALFNNVELYRKSEISEMFPDLKDMLNRTGENLQALENYKNILTGKIINKQFNKLKE